jgi:hypothetical protein
MAYHFVPSLHDGIGVVYKLLLVLSLEFDVVEIKGFQDVVG